MYPWLFTTKAQRVRTTVLVLGVFYGLLCSSFASGAEVETISLSRAPDHTRLVFDISEDVSFNIFDLDNPDRVVIDLENVHLQSDLPQFDYTDTPIELIRAGVRNGNDLRIVLDLTKMVDHTHFSLAANGEFRDRLVLDLLDENFPIAGVGDSYQSSEEIESFASVENIESSSNTEIIDATPITATTRTVPNTAQSDRRDILVAVVAGHGGEDPGAPSHDRKLWEKDVTLAISRAMQSSLLRAPGYTPVMIRDGDYSVDLKSRPVIARDKRVDIYISIHADSYRGSSVQGVTVYALSGETADQENIRRVEEKENMADLLGGFAGDTRISDVDDDLALTLLDLSMAWSMEQSVELGAQVLASLDGVAKLRKDKVQGGNLWELRSPDIPSILIETGYLSNPSEAKKLATPAYQRDLANGIVQGLKNYFFDSPPDGTLVAWQKQNGVTPETYLVKRNDNLSEIAQRFNVTLAELKSANSLRGNVIQIGQSLTIPGAFGLSLASEHKIIRGETLSEIAQRYKISLANLRRANNLSGDTIRIGQVLKIPTS
jgi:N-acetylmuramoyl-L-alanine amidase